jgi:hypothetical protein
MKPATLPDFREGIEYRQLHPTKEGGRRWRFKTCRGIRLRVDGIIDNRIICYHDAIGKVWARHDRYGIYVEEGYCWNGCTPKRWYPVLGWCGTPDFHCTRLASLCHDVGYQFSRTEHFPLHKSDVDALFYHTICMAGDPDIASVYHGAVCKFGKWTEKPNNGEFSTIL